MKSFWSYFILSLSVIHVNAQSPEQLNNWALQKTVPGITELRDFIAIPNDAVNLDDINMNVEWLKTAFTKRNFTIQVLETENTPLFFAEKKVNKKAPTVLFYMHYDGQSVDKSKWDQDDPFKAVLKKKVDGKWIETDWEELSIDGPEYRIFGRSSSDDKGPIIMLLQAIDALEDNELKLKYNLKVVLDGEEEKGGNQLPEAVAKYRDILQADHMIINDGPKHLSGKPTLVFGCRGNTRVDITVYGTRVHQHSGHYGNYAPNPVFMMAHLLASMKSPDGRVIIEGYYDGIDLNNEIKERLAAVPDDVNTIHQTIGIAKPEAVGNNIQEALQFPSLNVRGISAAWIGKEARTIVPQDVTAAFDLRLVPESDPDRLKLLIKNHIEGQGYYVIDRAPTEQERMTHPKIATYKTGKATLPFRTDLDSETGDWLSAALKKGLGEDPVKIRIMGGTVPTSTFINELNVPAIIVPLVNPDNNQHSPNENLRVGNFTYGVQAFLSILLNEPE
ncbi:MAG: M20/M25/M40 family metallo-hydrolase [Cyclobacteriaceae bacterium]